MKSKVMDLQEVVREIPDKGASIGLGGFIITRCPIAFVCELIRQKKAELSIYSVMGNMESDMLVGAGLVKSYSYPGGSLDRFGRINRINEAIEKGACDIKEYSGLTISLRALAGSMGIPFIPTKATLGTDILKGLLEKDQENVIVVKSPFDGETYVYLRSLQPDYSVIHVPFADEKGNAVITGPLWDVELAKAGKKLIITAEKVVSSNYMKRMPNATVIPGVFTYAVCEVPYGGYPGAVFGCYDYDAALLTQYAKINKTQADFDNWLNEYVLGTKNHHEFLDKCGGLATLQKLQVDPFYGYAKGGQ